MIAQFVELSVFSTPEDEESKVYSSLLNLIPLNLEAEKLKIEKTSALGFTERKITIFRIRLTKQKHINIILENLVKSLSSEQKELLVRQLDSRLDEELYFYIRLDKERLINKQEYWITEEGNCYHVKIAIAAFPRKREIATELVNSLLSNSKAI